MHSRGSDFRKLNGGRNVKWSRRTFVSYGRWNAEVDDLFKLIVLFLWKTAPFWLPEDKLTFGSRG
ncbi:MAG: hypothetical protein ACTS5A_03430 [Candidatus Hodgkinia cicadicola]